MATPDQRAFLRYPREDARKRPVEERRSDWRPIQEVPDLPLLARQTARCMGCGVPFCQGPTGCPLDNLIPDWNDLVRRGHMQEALTALHATNNFPEFTGILCPAPCESACVLDLVSEPVTIRGIEAGIIEHGFANGWVRPQPAAGSTGRKVAVVGSGPAGLAAAQQLARAGHQVVVFEKAARPGGLLRYGIPDFKIDKAVVERRLRQLEAEGVEFRTGVEVGRDVGGDELQREYHAVCLTVGAGAARDLEVPGRELAGIHLAMEYLTRQNQAVSGEGGITPAMSAEGKHVVIIGGGDTGSDCLGTAHRQGCIDAVQLELLPRPPSSRSDATPWPHWPMRLVTSHAHEEGGRRDWGICTVGFTGDEGGVTGVRTQRADLRGGRAELVPGTEAWLPAELVLLAIGFRGPDLGGLVGALPVALDERGNIRTDATYRTSLPGVFAAGDARRGASLIVWAIAEGRKMAASVEAYLRQS
jgi:glutamate synthase (NADPH/NADH) small chain